MIKWYIHTSVKILCQSHGTFVQGVPELHPDPELDKMRNLGQQLNDGVLQGGSKKLSRELVGHPQLLQTLGGGRGLDDVDHHVRCDGVGLQVQGSDGFIGLQSFCL